MAYAALVSLSQTIDIILNYHQDFISVQVKDQIISIHEHAIFLQVFLEHFADKVTNFESIIRAVAHTAEDIIELFMLDSSLRPFKSNLKQHQDEENPENHHCPDEEADIFRRRTWLGFAGQDIAELFLREDLFRPIPTPLESSVRLSNPRIRSDFHELKEAAEEIESIAGIVKRMMNSIIAREDGRDDPTSVSSSSRAGGDHRDSVVGFESDVEEIKSRLCRESSKREVIPVVGMGGIGKTTLARSVYDDPLIMEHFQICVWVTVSQDYSVEEIVSCLLISMKVFEAKSKSMRKEHVYQHLKGRRYLIVLDDIWSVNAWDELNLMFPDDGNGSRILLTTRLSDVASYADSCSRVHEMHLMHKDLSWILLRQKVFKRDPCPVELEYIGKKIARSCRGLPLAIVVISGILSSIDQTATAWENVAKNVASVISANNEQFDKILGLSYTHLPHHLRPCFLYMGGFSEDYQVRASKLVKLLVAEGFLRPNEETAEEYLEDLVKRSLVLVTKRKSDGRIKRLSMHDLMRELSIRIARAENFFQHGRVSLRKGINIHRRVSNLPSHLDLHDHVYGPTIRTILAIGSIGECELLSIPYFRLLRVLDLLDASIPPLPAQVLLELFHLRYLAFNGFFKIPAGISNLQNLQTLIIYSYPSYEYLPYYPSNFVPFLMEIWTMPQLRHLFICSGFCFCLPPLLEGATPRLKNLQTLSLAINFICTREILETIPNLKKLAISYSACRNNEQDYQLHNLIYFQHLENLKLKVHGEFRTWWKLRPDLPRTLKKLSLSGFGPNWENMKVLGSLPKLQVLKLRNYACYGDTWETNEEEFPQLKFLLIDESKLQHWITESSHFPRLECLVLHSCWYLSEIPSDIGDVPTLELIEVDDDFLLESAKQIQDDQKSCGNDSLQVRFVKLKSNT